MSDEISLKSALYDVAIATGITPDSLYRVQRDLVSSGILKPRPGRGPGSGVVATPGAIAVVVAHYMAERPPIEAAAIINDIARQAKIA